jgi:hypothetical protein
MRMSKATETRVPCSQDTKRLLIAQKRGGDTYDGLFRKMIEQYDPSEAHEVPQTSDANQ